MSVAEKNLFKIGEIAKILGISRKMILNYENMGLLTPAMKKEDSGYRYYTADNMTQIRAIRSLQALGLSLAEVREYYYDIDNIDIHLQRLIALRADLERNIQMLQVRSTKQGDLTVHHVTLSRQVCFCRQFLCQDTKDASERLRETYVAAAQTGAMSMTGRMFTQRMGDDPAVLDLLCCIPIEDDFHGPERQEFPETQAVCIYYRGPYEGSKWAFRRLADYIKENEIQPTGLFRSIYMEGPPNRGKNSEDYITQIAIPVAGQQLRF